MSSIDHPAFLKKLASARIVALLLEYLPKPTERSGEALHIPQFAHESHTLFQLKACGGMIALRAV